MEWTGPEVTTTLAAHQQLQSLETAQIAELLQGRIEELRRENDEQEQEAEEGDDCFLM